jgi:ABC-type dipeptide/oligopeptide/nickel transport system permease subunit
MATAQTRIKLTLLSIRNLWRLITGTKRGKLGVAVIAIFVPVALLGPMTTSLDPLTPLWPGEYPAGSPTAAHELCVPVWYRILPGGADAYSENMEAVADYKFSSNPLAAPTKWSVASDNPTEITVGYSSTKGTSGDGAIEISYQTDSSDTSPKLANVTLSFSFVYPFKVPPKRFWIHHSILTEGPLSESLKATMELAFRRRDASQLTDYTYPERDPETRQQLITQEDSLWVYKYPLTSYPYVASTSTWISAWTRSTKDEIWNNIKWQWMSEMVIFPTKGNYTLDVKLQIADRGGGGKNIKVYLDNINVLIYGSAFGPLGTTDASMGSPRDLYTALIYGARISVIVGLLVAFMSVFLGLFVGITAGYTGGWTDEILMRLADFLIGLPGLPLLIVLAFVLSPSIFNVIFLLAFMGWMGFSRSVRSVTLSLRERAFVEAAKASGSGRARILGRHIVPNVLPLVYLALATSVPAAIVAEASLSFLGLFDPMLMTWGRLLNEFARSGIAVTKGFSEYWFWVLPPGIAIASLAISFILIGYSLDETLNPRLRRQRR